MPIVCPHCATSYTVDSEKLGTGRSVRCARCKQVWVATPQPQLAMTADVEWAGLPPEPRESDLIDDHVPPEIESPSIAADWPATETGTSMISLAAPSPSTIIHVAPAAPARDRRSKSRRGTERRTGAMASLRLPVSIAAMGGLIAALLVWRGDVVRLMPQTAVFYKTVGLDVNLRGLSFRDVRLGNETVDGKPVLIVEGEIVDDLKKPLEIPRLRFVVRDVKGTAVYAWNAAPEQTVIQPGERVMFRSRLAQPPAEAHSIDVRFFTKRDLAADGA